ncbi:hypothetical protein BTR23_18670 [Alkalihalophilus pseudofirmus]|nr:hypothetical protein BTR23_18670 [Alkalihalophilus pseudofirmus]
MDFWGNTISSAIGAFVGVGGAFVIARWQLNRAEKQNNYQYFLRFNEAQIYINNFERKIEEIIDITQSGNRGSGRFLLSRDDFLLLKEDMDTAIRVLNPKLEEIELENFSVSLGKINENAPIVLYKEMNGLFFSMAILYNLLLEDCRNLVNDIPDRVDLGYFNYRGLSLQFMVNNFKKKYKKMKRKLKV